MLHSRPAYSLLAATAAAVGLKAAYKSASAGFRCSAPRATAAGTAPSLRDRRQLFGQPDGLGCPWRAPGPALPCCHPNAGHSGGRYSHSSQIQSDQIQSILNGNLVRKHRKLYLQLTSEYGQLSRNSLTQAGNLSKSLHESMGKKS